MFLDTVVIAFWQQFSSLICFVFLLLQVSSSSNPQPPPPHPFISMLSRQNSHHNNHPTPQSPAFQQKQQHISHMITPSTARPDPPPLTLPPPPPGDPYQHTSRNSQVLSPLSPPSTPQVHLFIICMMVTCCKPVRTNTLYYCRFEMHCKLDLLFLCFIYGEEFQRWCFTQIKFEIKMYLP